MKKILALMIIGAFSMVSFAATASTDDTTTTKKKKKAKKTGDAPAPEKAPKKP